MRACIRAGIDAIEPANKRASLRTSERATRWSSAGYSKESNQVNPGPKYRFRGIHMF